jgi:hypothetical protein
MDFVKPKGRLLSRGDTERMHLGRIGPLLFGFVGMICYLSALCHRGRRSFGHADAEASL